VRAITTLSQSLGLEVVAEGIERADQFDSLCDLPCSKGQGYLFGRPVPAHDMTRLLAAAARPVAI
jgi:EAL domain-containing protein (putative c-di-GMP-specific phosphodiesterase class I)